EPQTGSGHTLSDDVDQVLRARNISPGGRQGAAGVLDQRSGDAVGARGARLGHFDKFAVTVVDHDDRLRGILFPPIRKGADRFVTKALAPGIPLRTLQKEDAGPWRKYSFDLGEVELAL